MKLPRLQYTYVVFYATSDYGTRSGNGWIPVEMQSTINTPDDVYRAQQFILDSNSQYKNICITNYKLLSVRIVWE